MNIPYSLDFSIFKKALGQLQKSIAFLHSDLAKDKDLYEQFRGATIQAFEYSYELSHKSLKRFLKIKTPSSDVIEAMSFPELIRTGHDKGLLQNSWSVWQIYRESRNRSSHAYDENIADDVAQKASAFLQEGLYLYHQLEAKKDA